MPLPGPAAELTSRWLFPSLELFDRTRSCSALESRTATEMTELELGREHRAASREPRRGLPDLYFQNASALSGISKRIHQTPLRSARGVRVDTVQPLPPPATEAVAPGTSGSTQWRPATFSTSTPATRSIGRHNRWNERCAPVAVPRPNAVAVRGALEHQLRRHPSCPGNGRSPTATISSSKHRG